MGKKKVGSTEKKQVNEKRRAAAGQDYERLAEQGPPADAKWAFLENYLLLNLCDFILFYRIMSLKTI